MTIHQKVLDIYHNDGHDKAWAYWKLMGLYYGIFLGEVPSSEFITGDSLTTALGITEGLPQHSDTPWLKFILDGDIVFITKKPIRYGISWEHIYQAGAVYGSDDSGIERSVGSRIQDACVIINGLDFRTALIKGVNVNIVPNSDGWDIDWTHGSEWNRLMYPVHSGIHTNKKNPSKPSEPYSQWASYSDGDLLVDYRYGNGRYSITQEYCERGVWSGIVVRGNYGVTYATNRYHISTSSSLGWRPMLRMISS